MEAYRVPHACVVSHVSRSCRLARRMWVLLGVQSARTLLFFFFSFFFSHFVSHGGKCMPDASWTIQFVCHMTW